MLCSSLQEAELYTSWMSCLRAAQDAAEKARELVRASCW